MFLSGCDLLNVLAPPPLPPPPPPVRQSQERLLPDADAGLVPLPSPQQVVTAASLGRRNPFAPVVVANIPLPEGVTPGSPPAVAVARVSQAGGGVADQKLALQAALKLQAEAAGNNKAGSASAAAPLSPTESLKSSALQPPLKLLLTGVIQANGQKEAVVVSGSQSGSLRVGDRGGQNTTLLPQGWSVVAIHLGGRSPLDVPNLQLQQGNRRYIYRL